MKSLENTYTRVDEYDFDQLMTLLEEKTMYKWTGLSSLKWNPFENYASNIDVSIYIVFENNLIFWELYEPKKEDKVQYVAFSDVIQFLKDLPDIDHCNAEEDPLSLKCCKCGKPANVIFENQAYCGFKMHELCEDVKKEDIDTLQKMLDESCKRLESNLRYIPQFKDMTTTERLRWIREDLRNSILQD